MPTYANVPMIIAPKIPFAALEFKIDLMVTYDNNYTFNTILAIPHVQLF